MIVPWLASRCATAEGLSESVGCLPILSPGHVGSSRHRECAMLYRFGDYVLDTQLYELWHAGVPCRLEPQVFDLLRYLIQHRDRVVSKQELLEHVWADRFVSETTLDHRVMQARRAVGDSGRHQHCIKTVHSRGYRFVATVQEGGLAPAGPAVQAAPGLPRSLPGPPQEHPDPLLDARFPVSFTSPVAPGTPQRLSSWAALAGERKHVTVLCCSLAHAAVLAARLGPEEWHAVVQRFFELALREVYQYEGVVTQLLSDGFMALFGVPRAAEEHARQAVRAAVGIHQGLCQGQPAREQPDGAELAIRLGLHTGLVIVGTIGDNGLVHYTALGDTITLVSRLQQTAAPGTIQLTEPTYRLVAGYFRCAETGLVEGGDKAAPVRLYRVTGEHCAHSRFAVACGRGLTRFVGRARELAFLHDCLARAATGHGQVVGIVGEPGLGKSRLLYEFYVSLDQGRITWLEGDCLAHGPTTPYGPILGMLCSHFQIEEGEHPRQIRDRLRQGVGRLDAALESIVPFLEELFGLPGADDALRHLEPQEKRHKTLEALRILVFAWSQRQPQVLICENLHGIDQSSEDCLAMLIESLASMAVLVLTTHRPGYTVRWADTPSYTQIALDCLSAADAKAMVASLLGSHDLPPALLRLMQEKTGGNPLFIEEVVHAFLESGALVRHHGGIHWTGAAGAEFPMTMQDIVRARIDRLDEPVKRTVRTAAVIGREFGWRLLTRLVDPATELQPAIETLKHLELIHETRLFPEVEYRFKHAVTQEVAYASLLERQRQVLHGAIGQALEDLYTERRNEQAARLAYHYARSAHQDRAIPYALLAGDQAARLYAHAEATTYYTQALTMARALPASLETQQAQIDAALRLAAVGLHFARDGEHLAQARTLAAGLHDEPRLAGVLYWLGRLHYARGNFQGAIAHAQQSLTLADRLGDEALAAPPVNLLGRVYYMQTNYRRASQMMVRSVKQMRQLGNTTEEATIAAFAGAALAHLGDFVHALQYAEHGLHLTQELQNPFAEAAAYHYRGMLYDQYGEWPRALADYEAAQRLAEQTGDRFRTYIVQVWAGRAHTMAGNPSRGRALLEESMTLAAQLSTTFAMPCLHAFHTACLLALGEGPGLLLRCHEAIRLAHETGDKFSASLAYRTLAETLVHLEPADFQPTEHAMTEAIRLHQEIGNTPELARTYVRYARLLQRQGKPERARAYLTQASDLFRHMDMAWDLAQADQAWHALA